MGSLEKTPRLFKHLDEFILGGNFILGTNPINSLTAHQKNRNGIEAPLLVISLIFFDRLDNIRAIHISFKLKQIQFKISTDLCQSNLIQNSDSVIQKIMKGLLELALFSRCIGKPNKRFLPRMVVFKRYWTGQITHLAIAHHGRAKGLLHTPTGLTTVEHKLNDREIGIVGTDTMSLRNVINFKQLSPDLKETHPDIDSKQKKRG